MTYRRVTEEHVDVERVFWQWVVSTLHVIACWSPVYLGWSVCPRVLITGACSVVSATFIHLGWSTTCLHIHICLCVFFPILALMGSESVVRDCEPAGLRARRHPLQCVIGGYFVRLPFAACALMLLQRKIQ